MTPTRRTRKPKKSKLARNVLESSEEESSDAGSVTRCICGESHNLGLMVQCDKCEVWQHCECIGLIQEKLPDHYYCDKCQPEHHQFIKTPSGRSKRLYNATITTTVDNTNKVITNSDGDTTNCTPPSPSHKKRKTTHRNKPSRSPIQQQPSPKNEVIATVEEKEQVTLTTTTTTTVTTTTVTANLVSSPLKLEEETDLINEERLTRSRRTLIKPGDVIEQQETEETPTNRKKNTRRAISSSPSPLTAEKKRTTEEYMTPPYWNTHDGKPTRASSPPAKVKYPHSKMTFSDMNKRAKQIMECLSKMQTTTIEPKEVDILLFQQQRPRSLSTSSSSSSLSSASTVPLLDDYTSASSSPSTPLPFISKEDETSVDILERVNRELIKFQRKFGIAAYHHTHILTSHKK